VSPLKTDQNRQAALSRAQAPVPAQQTSQRRRSTAMTSEVCVSASTHRRLEEDFHFVVETCRNLEAQNKQLKKRNAKLTYLEFGVCQGDCDEELEDAHHRNWEKAQENDALRARIRELEQQAEQDKNKRPLGRTE
jgi:cell division protein FtsB